MKNRKLRKEEIDMITWIIEDTVEGQRIIPTLSEIYVEEMDDGGMGSLKVIISGEDTRLYSQELGKEADLLDIDNVPLFITVNLDTNGDLYELDVWKGDSSPLKSFPAVPK